MAACPQVPSLWLLPGPKPVGFPGGSDGKESACNVGDLGSIPGLGRSPGEGSSNPFQYSCLEISVGRGIWQATWGHKESDRTERLTHTDTHTERDTHTHTHRHTQPVGQQEAGFTCCTIAPWAWDLLPKDHVIKDSEKLQPLIAVFQTVNSVSQTVFLRALVPP